MGRVEMNGEHDEADAAGEAKEERLIAVILPAAIAVVMLALVLSESEAPSFELRVTAPSSVAPEGVVPVRAEVLSGMELPEGPSVVRVPVAASIVDGSGRVRARMRLASSRLAGAEGTLRAPADAGAFTLVLETDGAHGDMRVERMLSVGRATRLTSRPRRSVAPEPLLGPIESTSAEVAPSELTLAIENGLCIPEVACRVIVRVGTPAAAIHIEPGSTVAITRAPRPLEQAGLVDAELVVHGPEPMVTLVATRGGAPVARREVVLPAGRGGLRIAVAKRVLARGERARVAIASFDGPRAAAIDVLRDGVWVAAASIDERAARDGGLVPLPHEAGRYMLVARGDFVSNDAASSVVVAVDEGVDPLVLAAREAPGEGRVVMLPPFTSAILQANTGAVQRRTARRYAAGFVILLCGAFASRRVTQRVLRASRQARAIMSEAGDETAQSEVHVKRDRNTALLVGALVFCAFAFAALLVLSRSVI